MKDEPVVVLDACALIAYFNDEAGAEVVAAALQDVTDIWISGVNPPWFRRPVGHRAGQAGRLCSRSP